MEYQNNSIGFEGAKVRKERFLILLVSFLAFIILDPILSPYPFGGRVLEIAGVILFFSCINAISDTKRRFVIAVLLFACSVLAKLAIHVTVEGYFNILSRSFDFSISSVFYLYSGYLMTIYVLSEGKVTRDKIAAAICVYLILGVIWGMFYGLAETLDPGALGGIVDVGSRGTGSAVYFSYITLTTLGYGDITPVSPTTRALAIVEAIAGQIYIAVMIARLVGLHTTYSVRK